MRSKDKKSIYRVLSDFVKSDSNIAANEIELLETLCTHFKIEEQDKKESYAMTLAEATHNLADLPFASQEMLIQKLEESALIDGECSREESMLITSLEKIWSGKGEILSIPVNNRLLLPTQILYIDPSSAPKKNELDRKYDEIKKIVELAGYDLVYIPQIASDYKNFGSENLKRLLLFLNPALEPEVIINNIKSLSEMTSRTFYIQILQEKLQMGLVINRPAFMIGLPNNIVDGLDYANYLIYYADNQQIGKQLQSLIERLNSRVGSYSVVVNKRGSRNQDFPYKGFHKILLDIMTGEKSGQCEIKIYVRGGEDMLVDNSEKGKRHTVAICKDGATYPVLINGREATYYLLLLCASASSAGFVDFKYDFTNPKALERVKEQYTALYRLLSNRDAYDEDGKQQIPNILISNTRRPIKTRVLKALNSCGVTGCGHLVKPKKKGLDGYYVAIPAENVKLVSRSGETPLTESEIFKKHFK